MWSETESSGNHYWPSLLILIEDEDFCLEFTGEKLMVARYWLGVPLKLENNHENSLQQEGEVPFKEKVERWMEESIIVERRNKWWSVATAIGEDDSADKKWGQANIRFFKN